MTIATVDDIVAGLVTQQQVRFNKTFAAPPTTGGMMSGWKAAGIPAAGVNPPAYSTSGYACDKATAGAFGPMTNAAVQLWLAKMMAASTANGTLMIFDRLWACSGMAPTGSATYTITAPSTLPARITDDGVGCELWLETYTAGGTVSGNVTANYVDPSGTAQVGTLLNSQITQSPRAASMYQVPLANGISGIKQLTSIVAAGTWTGGSFGATIMKPIVEIPVTAAPAATLLDWAQLGLPKIPNDACLMAVWFAANNSSPTVFGTLNLIDK